MNYNNDFKYDLKVGQVKEQALGEVFQSKTIEVKYDKGTANTTGNFFVEYEYKGKASGLATSKADFYCFVVNDTFHLIPTQTLKEKCRKYLNTSRDRLGGDNNKSKGILLPVKDLF